MTEALTIRLHVIPHSQQRYDTAGDWYYTDDGALNIVSSKMNESHYSTLLLIHELIEAILCRTSGVTQVQVDEWDMKFKEEGEPGDDIQAPYHRQHRIASIVEMLVAELCDVDWNKYSKAVDEL